MEGGEHVSLLWDSNSRAFTNSDNSGGGSDEKSGGNTNKKQIDSSSNRPSVVVVAAVGEKEEAGPVGKKRGRGGGKGSGDVKGGKKGGGGGGESDHEIHIWTERERRKKMRNMFANLHALLPQLPPKADKSTIVDEAVSYIKTLQSNLQKLQKKKLERLQGAATINYDPSSSIITQQKLAAYDTRESFLADQGSSNNLAITLANSSMTAFSPLPRYPVIFQTWTSQNVILNVCGNDAQISVCSPKKTGLLTTIFYVLEKHKIEVVSAHVSSDHDRSMYMIQAHASSGSSDQFMDSFPMEEIYRQAAGEIMFWVSS